MTKNKFQKRIAEAEACTGCGMKDTACKEGPGLGAPAFPPPVNGGMDTAAYITEAKRRADEAGAQIVQEALLADPWAHRTQGMRCRTCMSFVVKNRFKPAPPGDVRGRLGRCRAHAPTMRGYPAVFENDWCGDHKLDEDKL